MNLWLAAGMAFLVSSACFVPVLIHAFRQSLGVGLLVLCVPLFGPVYAFDTFAHRSKGLLLAGWLAAFLVGAVLSTLAQLG